MHRTVFEFLETPGVWNLECLQTQDKSFEPNSVLSCLSLHLLRLTLHRLFRPDDLIKDMLVYSVQAQHTESAMIIPLFMRFEEIIQASISFSYESTFLRTLARDSWINRDSCAETPIVYLIAIEIGLLSLVEYFEIESDLAVSRASSRYPLLFHAIEQPLVGTLCSAWIPISARMIKYLLSSGCDPNETVVGDDLRHTTPWISFLNRIRCKDVEPAITSADIMELFIRANANSDITDIIGEQLSSRIHRLFLNFGNSSWLGYWGYSYYTNPLRSGDKVVVREKGRFLLNLLQKQERQPQGCNPNDQTPTEHERKKRSLSVGAQDAETSSKSAKYR